MTEKQNTLFDNRVSTLATLAFGGELPNDLGDLFSLSTDDLAKVAQRIFLYGNHGFPKCAAGLVSSNLVYLDFGIAHWVALNIESGEYNLHDVERLTPAVIRADDVLLMLADIAVVHPATFQIYEMLTSLKGRPTDPAGRPLLLQALVVQTHLLLGDAEVSERYKEAIAKPWTEVFSSHEWIKRVGFAFRVFDGLRSYRNVRDRHPVVGMYGDEDCRMGLLDKRVVLAYDAPMLLDWAPVVFFPIGPASQASLFKGRKWSFLEK